MPLRINHNYYFHTSHTIQGLSVALSDANDVGLTPGWTASIALPSDIANHVQDREDIRVAFTFYRDADLFPIRNNNMEDERTIVGSSVLSSQVSGVAIDTELNSPVQLFFVLNNASVPGPNETARMRCVFWDFTSASKQSLQ